MTTYKIKHPVKFPHDVVEEMRSYDPAFPEGYVQVVKQCEPTRKGDRLIVMTVRKDKLERIA